MLQQRAAVLECGFLEHPGGLNSQDPMWVSTQRREELLAWQPSSRQLDTKEESSNSQLVSQSNTHPSLLPTFII